MTQPIEPLAAALADRYRIERELGAGGMATVYLAEDLKHRRKVAIKVLRPDLAAAIGVERFLREIRTIASLSHPHILGLIDSGEVDDSVYYVMPFVDGESLGDRLRREGSLPVAEAVRLTREIADALGYAHARGIVHRDLKPDNILLASGHALVADFGIALPMGDRNRMTDTGLALGTPGYMSPEQAAGERTLDGRSDLFALGCVFYEMLVGQAPFDGPTAQARIARTFAGQFAPVGTVKPETGILDPVVARLLVPEVNARFPDVATFLAALDGAVTRSSYGAPTELMPVARSSGRRRLLVAGVAVVLLAGLLYLRSRTAVPERVGLAVVPFYALTETEVDSAVARAMVAGLASRLSMLRQVDVSATREGGSIGSDSTQADLTRYGLRVGARYVLTGGVRWQEANEVVQVRPRLFEIAAGAAPVLRWSDSFSTAPAELFKTEITIAHDIARVLRREPRASDAVRLDQPPTRISSAYLEYLLGVTATGQEAASAQTRLERAVGLDSNFSLAWAALGSECAVTYRQTQSPVSRACAQRGAERAMVLDSNLADSRYAAGLYARHVLQDFPQARVQLERAVALAPWDSDNASMLVAVLMSLGEWDQARVPASRAEALEPLSPNTVLRVADIAIAQHQYAEATAALDRAMALDSMYSLPIALRALAMVQQGELPGAQRYLAAAPYRGQRLTAITVRGLLYGRIWFLAPAMREEILAAPVTLFDSHRARQLLAFAQVHWLAGRFDRARQSASAAVPWARQDVAANPDNDEDGMRLAFALALAGQRDDAIKEGGRSSALRPVSRDARIGPFTQLTFAEVLTVAGARDSAIAVLTGLSGRPGPATPGWMASDPFLAPLAGMPAFDALAGSTRSRT